MLCAAEKIKIKLAVKLPEPNSAPAGDAVQAPLADSVLGRREREILDSLLAHYLASGEPVASGSLVRENAEHLSSASIRSVLAVLEQSGWVRQPHASAGRVPTPRAMRYYAARFAQPRPLAAADAARLRESLEQAGDFAGLLAASCRFLADFTRQAAIGAITPEDTPGIREIRFLRLSERRVLSLLETSGGAIWERVTRVPENYTQDELDHAARYLTRNFPGWTLERMRQELTRRVSEDSAAYDRLLERVLVLYHCGVLAAQRQDVVFMEGAPHLAALIQSQEQLAAVLAALTTKETLLQLLQELIANDPAVYPPRLAPRVRIGLDQARMAEMAVVWAPCQSADGARGAIAVLGSMRMDYHQMMGAIEAVEHMMLQRQPGS